MDKKAVVHIHSGILLSHLKEYIQISSNEVDETGAYYKQCCYEHWGTRLFQFWFPQCVCSAVGLLGHMAVQFAIFKESPHCSP